MSFLFHKPREEAQALIYIYESEFTAMNEEVKKFPDKETGGDLYGTFTHANMPVVWLATGPGPNAKRSTAEFEQDADFRSQWQEKLMGEYGIQFIGSWHSHHQLGLTRLSSGDMQAAESYLRRHNRSVTIEVIATIETRRYEVMLRPYYHLVGGSWILAAFSMLQGKSPVREKLERGSYPWKNTNRDEQFRQEDYKVSDPNTLEPSLVASDVADMTAGCHSTNEGLDKDLSRVNSETTLLVMELTELALDIEYDKRDNRVMLILPLGEQISLAVVVEDMKDFIRVFQANIISKVYGINQDITKQLLSDRILLKSKDAYEGSVKQIYQYSRNYIQKTMHFSS